MRSLDAICAKLKKQNNNNISTPNNGNPLTPVEGLIGSIDQDVPKNRFNSDDAIESGEISSIHALRAGNLSHGSEESNTEPLGVGNSSSRRRKNSKPKLLRTASGRSEVSSGADSEQGPSNPQTQDTQDGSSFGFSGPPTPGQLVVDDEGDTGSLNGDFPVLGNAFLPPLTESGLPDPVSDFLGPPGMKSESPLLGNRIPTPKPLLSAFVAMSQANPSLEHYITRYVGNECGREECRLGTSREHFHCKQCKGRLFTKKEEMLRHYKWHRKREESLSHGFMRYSASDLCSSHFPNCPHNMRQTHYHCLQQGCDKVYISTSDVQMHANSHRKAAHIAREGFQRFKASENCNFPDCPFADPVHRTTHFHCLRPGCTHSFKNKSDMDKHKAHHLKDEQLIRDGFKKFMKSESCTYPACPFSRVVNHIHCIRRGCDYVLHSTTQMYSHKRKHEKQDKRAVDLALAHNPTTYPSLGPPPFLNPAALAAVGASILRGEPSSATLFPQRQSVEPPKPQIQGVKIKAELKPEAPVQQPTQKKFKIKHYDPSSQQFHSDSDSPNSPGDSQQRSQKAVKRKQSTGSEQIEVAFKDAINYPPIKIKQYDPASQNFIHTETLGREVEETKKEDQQQAPSQNVTESGIKEEPEEGMLGNGINLQLFQQPLNLLVPTLDGDDRNSPDTNSNDGQLDERQAENDKKNKSSVDSWKAYITRYTANDPCVPHCVLLYKDHYHCTSGEGCTITFRNKEGVREHARQHQLLDQASEHFEKQEAHHQCNREGCPFSGKEKHYHCVWTGCNEVIGMEEPVFRRLEHFKVHEYQTLMQAGWASIQPSENSGDDQKSSGGTSDGRRKRGRPPKYQALDVTVSPDQPGSVMTPEMIFTSFKLPKSSNQMNTSRRGRPRTVSSPRQGDAAESNLESFNQFAAQMNQPKPDSPSIAEPQLKPTFDGFQTYMPSELCNDSSCKYSYQMHFHCQAPRCFYSTSKSDQLENHSHDFHDSLEIPEGFACYDKSFNCKFPACPYAEKARHFHCLRIGCGEGFLKVNVLEAHEQSSHPEGKGSLPLGFEDPMKLIRTAGTFFPEGSAAAQNFSNLLCSLGASTGSSSQLPSAMPYTIEQHCGRPFCKLKRRIHFHCTTCFQGFSNASRLLPHLQKHGVTLPPQAAAAALIGLSGITSSNQQSQQIQFFKPQQGMRPNQDAGVSIMQDTVSAPEKVDIRVEATEEEDEGASSSKKIKFHHFQPQLLKFTSDGRKLFSETEPQLPRSNGSSKESGKSSKRNNQAKNVDANGRKQFKFVDCTQDAVDAVLAASRQEEPAPDGYARFNSRADCGLPVCVLKGTLHFHCLSPGCGYAISDKSQIQIHTDFHTANPSGPPFAGLPSGILRVPEAQVTQPGPSPSGRSTPSFRKNMAETIQTESCKLQDCQYQIKGVHFHCVKCPAFWSTDSTKYTLHMRQHAKQDQVIALGFEKVSPSIDKLCHFDSCGFTAQVHYHCVSCKFICLNQLQMSMHKAQHDTG